MATTQEYDETWRVRPELQQQRDRVALALKEQELADDPQNPALQRDVAFTRDRLSSGTGLGPSVGGGGGAPLMPPPPGTGGPSIPTTTPQIQSLERQQQEFQQQSNARLQELSQGRDIAAQGAIDAFKEKMPVRPELGPLPKYEAQPYSQENALAFGAIATAFAALAGLRTRAPLTAAMNAAGQAMQGYTTGRLIEVNTELNTFRTQFNSALASNEQMLKEYQSIINDRNLTRAEKMAEWQVAAARWKDEATMAMMRNNQYDLAIHRLYTSLEGANKLAQHADEFEKGLRNKIEVAQIQANAKQGGIPGMNSAIPEEHANLHGDEYLATLPSGVANSIKAIAEGRASLNSLSIRQGAREQFLQMVSQYDPNFDATRFPGNQAFATIVGRRGAQLSLAGQEAAGLAEAALKEYQNVWRTDYMPVNEVIARVAQGGGSPDERRVQSRINSLVNVYARAINPVGPATVSDKEHAREILNRADSPSAFQAAIETLMDEIRIAEKTFAGVQQRGARGASEEIGGGKPSGGLSPEKEQRYQELLRKRNAQ